MIEYQDPPGTMRVPANPGCSSHGLRCAYDNFENEHRCSRSKCHGVIIIIPKDQYLLWAANRIKGVPI